MLPWKKIFLSDVAIVSRIYYLHQHTRSTGNFCPTHQDVLCILYLQHIKCVNIINRCDVIPRKRLQKGRPLYYNGLGEF